VGKPLGNTTTWKTGVDGRIILKQVFQKWVGGIDWIGLAQERDSWQTLVNAVMKPRVP
jgi:hypothetical protein